MQSPILHPSLQWRCLLLILMAIPVAATIEEGTVLRSWLSNMIYYRYRVELGSWTDDYFPDPCQTGANWHGVSCGDSDNVLSVDLRDYHLLGRLVPKLGQLSHLSSLTLDNNIFYGTIPQEFGNLLALTNLSLSTNILSGPIPASLGKLSKLKYLSLSRNGLSGPIPASLGKLSKLEYLDLGGNSLNGSIPQEFGNLSALTNLTLNDNALSGPYPESLASLPFLSTINFDMNNISGTLNVGRILELWSTAVAQNNLSFVRQSISLISNNISNVTSDLSNMQIHTGIVLRLQGNPYCAGPTNLYNDPRRYICKENFVYTEYDPYRAAIPSTLAISPSPGLSPAPGLSPSPRLSPPSGSRTNSKGMIIGIICGILFLFAIFVGVIIKCKLSKSEDKYKQSTCDTQEKQFKSLSTLPHGNMGARFLDALRIINDVKDFNEYSFRLNTHQCMRLVGFYLKVGEFFENARKACEDFPIGEAMLSLDATLSVLQKGQVLLTKYTKDDWHTSVITGGLNQGSFDAIHLELEACIQSIREFFEEKVPGIMQWENLQTPLILLAERDRATILEGDAERDKKDMLAKVKSTRLKTNNTRSLTEDERSSKNLALDIASASLEDEKPRPTVTTKFEELPTALRINPSHIELGESLGSGGSAEVLKCRWSNVDCAVKILRRGDVNGLRVEVGKLMELRHPNIVSLFGFSVGKGVHEGRPMVVMELLNGDLRLLQRQLRLSMSKAVDVMHKIATAMAYLHSRGIFHGDLKSMNVLVNNFTGLFEVKITDFGVSQQIYKYSADHDVGATNTKSFNGRVGTPMWMAPEVLTSSSDVNNMYSAKADVYSFAMVCVEILTGKMPYNCRLEKIKDIREYVVDEGKRPELPLSLPSDLRELIVQCWDLDPEHRPDFHQICTRLQKLQVHSLPLQKWRWKPTLCIEKQ